MRNFMATTLNKNQILIACQIKRDYVGRTCGTHGRKERRIKLFGGKICRKKTLGRPRRRWEYNIIFQFQKVRWKREPVASSSARDKWQAFVSAVMNVWVP